MQSVITYSCFSYSACTTTKCQCGYGKAIFKPDVTDGVEANLSRRVSTSHLSLFNGEVVYCSTVHSESSALFFVRLRLAVSLESINYSSSMVARYTYSSARERAVCTNTP